MTRLLKCLPMLITASALAQNTWAFQAGWRQISIAGPRPDAPATTVALYYPTQTRWRARCAWGLSLPTWRSRARRSRPSKA